MKPISFNITAEENILINAIVNRAIDHPSFKSNSDTQLGLNMDISAVHCNGCRLRLKDFLEGDDFDFFHDIYGIQKNLNRTTGRLESIFYPRFAE